jgi:Multiubiquitin
MSSDEDEAAAHPKEFTIVVDTVEHPVDDATVSWTQVVEIAYPGQSEDERYVFKVQYEDAKGKPHAGTLVKDGNVEVKKNGTTFSVLRSVVS